MSGHADTTLTQHERDWLLKMPGWSTVRGAEVLAKFERLEAKLVEQADRIAWLEGDVAGWRIKLAECEERQR